MSANYFLNSLSEGDPEIFAAIQKESVREENGLELIASENYVSKAVLEAQGSILTNKYAEGYPTKRYYGGQTYTDELEFLCQDRARKAFKLSKELWHVNVQAHSGSPANLSVYLGLVPLGGKIMGMTLTAGGHLTHRTAPPDHARFNKGYQLLRSPSPYVDL